MDIPDSEFSTKVSATPITTNIDNDKLEETKLISESIVGSNGWVSIKY